MNERRAEFLACFVYDSSRFSIVCLKSTAVTKITVSVFLLGFNYKLIINYKI